MKPKYFSLIVLICVSLTSCAVLKKSGQGLQGNVLWLEGNQMPRISDDPQPNINPSGSPVQRIILIYPLTNLEDAKMENGLFQTLATSPLLEIETDEEGKFSVELEPGIYSVFTKEENGFFANSFDTEGNIQPIRIQSGEWTKLTIKIDYKAYY